MVASCPNLDAQHLCALNHVSVSLKKVCSERKVCDTKEVIRSSQSQSRHNIKYIVFCLYLTIII
jgi:hypothetical protein